MDMVLDLVHEVRVYLRGPFYGEVALEKNVKRCHRKYCDWNQNRAAFLGHLPKADGLFLSRGQCPYRFGGLGDLKQDS